MHSVTSCTKSLHHVANSNRRNNSIDQLEVNGTVSSYQSKMITLCNSTIACSPKDIVGGLGWLVFLLFPLGEWGHLVGETF